MYWNRQNLRFHHCISYVAISAQSPVAMQYANEYGMIVSIGSIGLFLEGNWTKVLRSG